MIVKDIDLQDLVASLVNLAVVVTSLTIAWLSFRRNHEWNRRKATQDVLDKMIFGQYMDLSKQLRTRFGIEVYDRSVNYKAAYNKLHKDSDKLDLDDIVSRLLNTFEVISINIKNNIIDEDICYDYLGGLYIAYYYWSKPFIDRKRTEADSPSVLINFSNRARKWEAIQRRAKDKNEEYLMIKGKVRL